MNGNDASISYPSVNNVHIKDNNGDNNNYNHNQNRVIITGITRLFNR